MPGAPIKELEITMQFHRYGNPAKDINNVTPGFPKVRIWEVTTTSNKIVVNNQSMTPITDGSQSDGFYKFLFTEAKGFDERKKYLCSFDGGTSLPNQDRYNNGSIMPFYENEIYSKLEDIEVSISGDETTPGLHGKIDTIDGKTDVIDGKVERVDDTYNRVNAINNKVNTIEDKVERVDDKVDNINDKVNDANNSLATLDIKANVIDEKVDDANTKLNVVDGKVDGVKTDVASVDSKVVVVDGKVVAVDGKVTVVDGKVDDINQKVDGIDVNIDRVENKVDQSNSKLNTVINKANEIDKTTDRTEGKLDELMDVVMGDEENIGMDSKVDSILYVTNQLRKFETNRTTIDVNKAELIVFDDDCSTILWRFKLLDHKGEPNIDEIAQRVPMSGGSINYPNCVNRN